MLALISFPQATKIVKKRMKISLTEQWCWCKIMPIKQQQRICSKNDYMQDECIEVQRTVCYLRTWFLWFRQNDTADTEHNGFIRLDSSTDEGDKCCEFKRVPYWWYNKRFFNIIWPPRPHRCRLVSVFGAGFLIHKHKITDAEREFHTQNPKIPWQNECSGAKYRQQ